MKNLRLTVGGGLALGALALSAGPAHAAQWYQAAYSGTYEAECLDSDPAGIFGEDSVFGYGTFIEVDYVNLTVDGETTNLARNEEIALTCDENNHILYDGSETASDENVAELVAVYTDPDIMGRALPILTELLENDVSVDDIDAGNLDGIDEETQEDLYSLDGADKAILRCALVREYVVYELNQKPWITVNAGPPEVGIQWCQETVMQMLTFGSDIANGLSIPPRAPKSYTQAWTWNFWEHLSGWSKGTQVNQYVDWDGNPDGTDSHTRRLQVRNQSFGSAGGLGASIMVKAPVYNIPGPCAIQIGEGYNQRTRTEDGELVGYGKRTRFAKGTCALPVGDKAGTLSFQLRFANHTRAVKK
jgi:hypothetical protein